MIPDHDEEILAAMEHLIERYHASQASIGQLVNGLDNGQQRLTSVSKEWKRRFVQAWGDIEIAYAVMLDADMDEPTAAVRQAIAMALQQMLELIGETRNRWSSQYPPLTMRVLTQIPPPSRAEVVLGHIPCPLTWWLRDGLELRRAAPLLRQVEAELASRSASAVRAEWKRCGLAEAFASFLDSANIRWECRRFIPDDSLYVVLFSPRHIDDSAIEAYDALALQMRYDIDYEEVADWVDRENVSLGVALSRVASR